MTYIIRLRFFVFVFTILLMPVLALSVEPNEILIDTDLEKRARIISKSLRCLVCRNENIDDSNAELARDLRILVRERLVLGNTDEEIIDYVVGRYGEYVLLKPKFNLTNVFLWFGGPVMLIFGILLAVWSFKISNKNNALVLSREDDKRISKILKD